MRAISAYESISEQEFKIILTELLQTGRGRFGLITVKGSEKRPPTLENPRPSKEMKITGATMENKTMQKQGQLGFENPEKIKER